MNKKLLMATITLIVVIMMVTPVMAMSPKKIPIAAEAKLILGSDDKTDPAFRSDLNEGGVRQWRALHSRENVDLTIGDSSVPIHFVSDVEMNGRWKTKYDQVNHVKVVWTDDAEAGGFEGVLQWKILYEGAVAPGAGTWHGVLQGWGTYEEQKLQLEGFWNGGLNPSTFTGFLLTP